MSAGKVAANVDAEIACTAHDRRSILGLPPKVYIKPGMSRRESRDETPENPSVTAKTQLPGTLIGYSTDSLTVIIELDDGRTIETVGAAQLEGLCRVGDAALVYFDESDKVIGWLVPAANAGVNLRHVEGT